MTTLKAAVIREVSDAIKDKVRYVTSGQCKDYTDYRARTAELVGMHNATQLFLDVEKRHNDNDDEE